MNKNPNPNLSYQQRTREITPNVLQGFTTPPGGVRPASSTDKSNTLGVKKPVRRVDIDLTAARTGGEASSVFNIRGNNLSVMNSTYPTDTVEIKIDEDGDWIPVGPGSALEGIPFETVRVKNAAQSGSTMTLCYYTDVPGDRASTRYR